jgi:hypothetical protein
VEFPTGSGRKVNLQQAAELLAKRQVNIFLPESEGQRPCHGAEPGDSRAAQLKDMVLFHEYFHGDTGQGLGASHQTGWTALVARLIEGFCQKKG